MQALVSRLQKDILPKIENQISELAKQDDPNEVTVTITNQLKVNTLVYTRLLSCWLLVFKARVSLTAGIKMSSYVEVWAVALLPCPQAISWQVAPGTTLYLHSGPACFKAVIV